MPSVTAVSAVERGAGPGDGPLEAGGEDRVRVAAGQIELLLGQALGLGEVGALEAGGDLTLAALYFRSSELTPLPMSVYRELLDRRPGVVAPIHARFTARGKYPIVATTPEYAQMRGLAFQSGGAPAFAGEAVLGATAARELGLGPGDTVFSDQPQAYDITRAPAIRLRITGVYAPSTAAGGDADDRAVFVSLPTAWMLEGIVHGHADPKELDDSVVQGRTERHTELGPAMVEENEATERNMSTFHAHGGLESAPLTAVLVWPESDKQSTITKARVNARPDVEMLEPVSVVGELLRIVLRIERVADAVFVVLAVGASALIGLVAVLSARLRAREARTLHRIGCGRWFVIRLYGAELGLIALSGVVVAAGAAAGVWAWAPAFSRFL